ncbi:hypothetical protein [Pseudactinotalea suaedae]|uniref:hypothetical protein n=1 Tax=Pseudactinotalea suaedae TaxID=1524924 RepID=UPI0012E326ED|nr:hypothetical protein [Pseudactinotalea suaedae]
MTRARLASLLAAGLLAATAVSGVGTPAQAAARVSIASDLGSALASLEGPTTISVSGSGFQSVQGGFGGIYVFFGWVEPSSSWRPSEGGRTGVDYLYVPDSEAKDNAGYQRFVTFPGSGTAAAANGGEVRADGSWDLTMVVPGPTFQAVDRDGGMRTVDCREVTCGLITIGAHGVANANNETFTPVEFISPRSGGVATVRDEQAPGSDPAPVEDTDDTEESADGATASLSEPATIGLEQSTIIAGRVLTFTGTGFQPGEQVVAVLGAGETGAGPLLAGEFGEVAGAVTLPPDLRPGTHVLTIAGAGSGQVAEATISVMADPSAFGIAADDGDQLTWPVIAVLVTGLVLAVLVLSSFVNGLIRRRRGRRAARSVPETQAAAAHAAPEEEQTAVLPAVPERRSAPERVDA